MSDDMQRANNESDGIVKPFNETVNTKGRFSYTRQLIQSYLTLIQLDLIPKLSLHLAYKIEDTTTIVSACFYSVNVLVVFDV